MASPVMIGTTASVVVPINRRRADVRFQNTGDTIIYLKKFPLTGAYTVVSASDYEVMLTPASSSSNNGHGNDDNNGNDHSKGVGESFWTDSIASFMAVSSASGGSLSIYETNKI